MMRCRSKLRLIFFCVLLEVGLTQKQDQLILKENMHWKKAQFKRIDYQSNKEVGSLGIEKPPDLGFTLSRNRRKEKRRFYTWLWYLSLLQLKDTLEQIVGSLETGYLRNGSSDCSPMARLAFFSYSGSGKDEEQDKDVRNSRKRPLPEIAPDCSNFEDEGRVWRWRWKMEWI